MQLSMFESGQADATRHGSPACAGTAVQPVRKPKKPSNPIDTAALTPQPVPAAPSTHRSDAQPRELRIETWGWDLDDDIYHSTAVIRYHTVAPDADGVLPSHPCRCGGRIFVTRASVFAPTREEDWMCVRCYPPVPESTVAIYELEEDEDADDKNASTE
jgi:hypothetical protein